MPIITHGNNTPNQIKLISTLFSGYKSTKLEIEMLKIGLKNSRMVNRDEEIESLSVGHPAGSNESGKSNVFNISKKTENIALSLEEKLHHETVYLKNRIALLQNVTEQIELYVSNLDEENNFIYTAKFIENKEVKIIASDFTVLGKYVSPKTISRKLQNIVLGFYKVTSLTDTQIINALEKFTSSW